MSNTTSSVPGATLYYQLFLCCLVITSAGAATCLYKCATDTILSNASPKEWAHTQTTSPCRSRFPLQTLSPSRISEGRGSGCLAPDRNIFQIGYPATTRGSASTAPLSLLRERLASREQHTSIPSENPRGISSSACFSRTTSNEPRRLGWISSTPIAIRDRTLSF
jgi:hypothetical protein